MSTERGTAALLTRRREILAQGAEPIGWKVGFNVHDVQRKLGLDYPVAGFLTTDTVLDDIASWSIEDDGDVLVESEIGVVMGNDGRSIAGVMAAIELVDPPDLELDIEQILAGNVFHRAVALGERAEGSEPGAARIVVNGEEQHLLTAQETSAHLDEMVEAVARRLAAAGEQLQPGEIVITGVLAPPYHPSPGDRVCLHLEAAGGGIELQFS